MSEPRGMTSQSPAPAANDSTGASQGIRRRLTWRKKVLFTLVVFAVIAAVPELLTRSLAPQFVNYRSTKEFTGGYPIGLRGADFGYALAATPKPSGEIRLVLVGDSVMWGCGLPLGDTIAVQTERKLNAVFRGWTFRCINFAGMGTTPALRRDYLLEQIKRIPIDALIYQFNINDVGWSEADAARLFPVEDDGTLRALFAQGATGLRQKYARSSAFLTLLEYKARAVYFAARKAVDPAVCGMAAVTDYAEVRARWDRQFQAMADLKSACDARGIGFFAYMFPASESISSDPRDNYYHIDKTKFTVDPYLRFVEYCAQYHLPGRTLFAAVKAERDAMIAGRKPYDPLYCYMDDNHPNRRGAEIFADAIVEDVFAGRVIKLPSR